MSKEQERNFGMVWFTLWIGFGVGIFINIKENINNLFYVIAIFFIITLLFPYLVRKYDK